MIEAYECKTMKTEFAVGMSRGGALSTMAPEIAFASADQKGSLS
jgi:hypothetical protein